MANYMDIIASCKDKPGGIIEAYHAIQKEYNYIPQEALKEAARAFKVSEAQAFGVATFYSYLSVEKRGKYIIRMCESAPCHVVGGREVIKAIKRQLGIEAGETTADGKFSLEMVSCLGVCGVGPVMMVNSETYGNLTPEKAVEILSAL